MDRPKRKATDSADNTPAKRRSGLRSSPDNSTLANADASLHVTPAGDESSTGVAQSRNHQGNAALGNQGGAKQDGSGQAPGAQTTLPSDILEAANMLQQSQMALYSSLNMSRHILEGVMVNMVEHEEKLAEATERISQLQAKLDDAESRQRSTTALLEDDVQLQIYDLELRANSAEHDIEGIETTFEKLVDGVEDSGRPLHRQLEYLQDQITELRYFVQYDDLEKAEAEETWLFSHRNPACEEVVFEAIWNSRVMY